MVPSAFVMLAEMPLNANGKLDRRALPTPEARPESEERVPPATPTEEDVAAIWCEVLGLSELSVTEDFFSLGGHSLLATQLISRIAARFSVRLGLAQIFENPTVRDLSRLIDSRQGDAQQPNLSDQAITAKSSETDLLEQAADLDDEGLDALLRSMQEN